jgi:Transposase DDE domain group 1
VPPGNAGSNTAADHIKAMKLALAQLPAGARRKVLARADSGGGTHEFLAWLHGRRLQYSVGIGTWAVPGIEDAVRAVPARAWTPAYDGQGEPREGAWVAEITGLLDLSGWPAGMRVIARKERPHPGAQLRLTDVDGNRVTCFATSTGRGQLADLELRHRRRARCEDRIRCAKDTGLRNLPLRGFDQNQVWCELVALASELTAWTQLLALDGPARRWEPRKLRFRLSATAGRLARGGRRLRLRIDAAWPWAPQVTAALTRLASLSPG